MSGLLLVCFVYNSAQGAKEQTMAVHDLGLGTKCDGKTEAFSTCMACSGLPKLIAIPADKCCTEYIEYSICEDCIKDIDTCLETAREIEKAVAGLLTDYNDYDNMDLFNYEDQYDDDSAYNLASHSELESSLFGDFAGSLFENLKEKRSNDYNTWRQSRFAVGNHRGQRYGGRYFPSLRNNKRNGPSRIFRKIYTGK